MNTWRKEVQDTVSWSAHQEEKREARELTRMTPTAKAAEAEMPRTVLRETQGSNLSFVV